MLQKHDNTIFLNDLKIEAEIKNFMKYRDFFLEMKEYLLANFKGKYVAIGEGGILGADDNERNLQKRIYEEHGKIQVFIDKAEESSFRKELPEVIFDYKHDILAV